MYSVAFDFAIIEPLISHHCYFVDISICSLNRIIPIGLLGMWSFISPLQHAIYSIFYPSLFWGAVSKQETTPFSHHTRFGGLDINNSVESDSLPPQYSCEGSTIYFIGQYHHQSSSLFG